MDTQYFLKHLTQSLMLDIHELSSLIGRSANCDMRIDRETLSREHARITIKRGVISVQDLHSTNGTFVNDRQISEETQIEPGYVVRFGQEAFCLQSTQTDATVVFDRDALNQSDSAMLVEDEEEEDGTVMLQSISLPSGWSKSGPELDQSSPFEDSDLDLLKALKKHAKLKLQHAQGLLITFVQKGKAPTVKLVSSEKSNTWVLGRSRSADILLDDARVSEKHANVEFSNDEWTLTDCDSRNGTYHKGNTISELKLTENTPVEIGPFTVVMEPVTK